MTANKLSIQESTEKAKLMVAFDAWATAPAGFRSKQFKDQQAYDRITQHVSREKPRVMELIEYISQEAGVRVSDIHQALREANSGRMYWDGKELQYTEPKYKPFEYRHAACAVLAYAIQLYWLRIKVGDQYIRDCANLQFSDYVATFYFTRGIEALQDLRDPVWDTCIRPEYRTIPRLDGLLGAAA